jgi:predicted nucleic-acid-binding protein
MVETVWVLDRAYGLTAQEIAATVERLLQVEVLRIEADPQVFAAMLALKQGRVSFADALIAELAAPSRMYTHLDLRPQSEPAFWLRSGVRYTGGYPYP